MRVVPYPVRVVKALGRRYLSRAACEKTADVCGSPRRRLRVVGGILAGLPRGYLPSCSGGSDTRTPGAPTTMAAICQGCLCFQCVTTCLQSWEQIVGAKTRRDLLRRSEIGIIERCGRYERLAPPGLRCVCWPLETVAGLCAEIGLDSIAINFDFRAGGTH